MGAGNSSFVNIVNESIARNSSTMNCIMEDNIDQSMTLDMGDITLKGGCNLDWGNRASVESNCDISSIIEDLRTQANEAKVSQTNTGAGLSGNNARTKERNIIRAINEAESTCRSGSVTKQTINNTIGDIACDDEDTRFVLTNEARLEPSCLLAHALKLEHTQTNTVDHSQLQLGGLIAFAIIAILTLSLLSWLLGGKKKNNQVQPTENAS